MRLSDSGACLPVLVTVALLVIGAAPASAQGTPLSSILPELLGNTITLLPRTFRSAESHRPLPPRGRPAAGALAGEPGPAHDAVHLSARIAVGRLHLHHRPGAGDIDAQQRQLRTLVRRARAHDRPGQGQRGLRVSARGLRHARGPEPAGRRGEVLRPAFGLLQPRVRARRRCRTVRDSRRRSKAT